MFVIGAISELLDKLGSFLYSDDILLDMIYEIIIEDEIQFPTDDQLR